MDNETDSLLPKASNCPSCNKQLDCASSAVGDERPDPGNITICMYCGHIMAFADDMGLRELTSEEMDQVAGNPLVLRVQEVRGEFMKSSLTNPDKKDC